MKFSLSVLMVIGVLLNPPGALAQTGEAVVGGSCINVDSSGIHELEEAMIRGSSDEPRQCVVTAQQLRDARRRHAAPPTAIEHYRRHAPEALAAAENASSRSPAAIPSESASSPIVKPEEIATPRANSPPPPAVADITRAAAGHGLVTEAAEIVSTRERTAATTSARLTSDYSAVRMNELELRLRESEATTSRLARELRERQDATDDERRLANLADDAAARDRAALADIADMRRSAAAEGRTLPNIPLSGPDWSNRAGLSSLLSPPPAGASSLTGDEYARQMALLAGLPPNQRDALLRAMGLDTMEVIVNGRRIRIPRLSGDEGEGRAIASHIGGTSVDTALPCAAFLESALPDELSRNHPTTLEWVAAHGYRSTGTLPSGPPVLDSNRRRYLEELARHFDAIDVYRGEANRPVPGDLLVLRAPAEREDAGRLLFVENYDPQTGVVEALEFSPKTRRPDRVRLGILKPGRTATGLIDHMFVMRIRRRDSGTCELPSVPSSRDARTT